MPLNTIPVFAFLRNCFITGFLCLALSGAVALPAAADNTPEAPAMPADVEAGLDHLITAVGDKALAADFNAIAAVLDYALQSEPAPAKPEAEPMPRKREQGNGIFMREQINVPMEKLVRYCYDPQVPPSVLFPNSIRRGHWLSGSDILVSGVKLWDVLDGLEEPLVMRGAEYEEITPDAFSGSYYGYTLNRLLIVLPYKGHRMFVSVSRQQTPSTVGMKGAIVGSDNSWDYVYSGVNGATARGIGWMDTYMYDSSTVTVFFDGGPESAQTQYAVFKWLKAGWANLNVVKRSHILSGTRRFLDGFRRIMEDSNLPPAEDIVRQMRAFESSSEQELQAAMRTYAQRLEIVAQKDDVLSRSDFKKIIANAGYAEHLNKDELIHDLMKRFIKSRLSIPDLAS